MLFTNLFYLKKYKNHKSDHYYDFTSYLDLIEETGTERKYINENDDQRLIDNFIRTYEGSLRQVTENRSFKRTTETDGTYVNSYHHLVKEYLQIIFAHKEEPGHFKKRCRFNPTIHFLYRNCISEFYWSTEDQEYYKKPFKFREKTCRGIVYIPLFNNPLEGDEKSKPIGYFIGHIKDSDNKGRCYYTHYQNEHQQRNEGVAQFFENDLYELGHIAATLGRIEYEELFVKGIMQKNLEHKKKLDLLDRRTSLSLTTHSFKTELNTTILPKVRLIKKKNPDPRITELYNQCYRLYNLTGIISLSDKIGDREEFISSGTRDKLLSPEPRSVDIYRCYENYQAVNPTLSPVRIVPDNLPPFSIIVYDQYLTAHLLELLLHTIFENLNQHSERIDGVIILDISASSASWVFSNTTTNESSNNDPTKLKGNLSMFEKIIQDTKSGRFSVKPNEGKFIITYQTSYYYESH